MTRLVVAVAAALLVLAVGVWAAVYDPPEPTDCAALIEQADYDPGVVTELVERGCRPTDHDPTVRP